MKNIESQNFSFDSIEEPEKESIEEICPICTGFMRDGRCSQCDGDEKIMRSDYEKEKPKRDDDKNYFRKAS